MSDTATATVAIPDDVRDNSPATVEVRWRDARPVTEDEFLIDKLYAAIFGYIVYEWETTDREGHRVTLTWFVGDHGEGRAVAAYETSYFTRVKCADCEYHWAQYYISVAAPHGDGKPFPQCGDHAAGVRSYQRRNPDAQVAFSEPLCIGQH